MITVSWLTGCNQTGPSLPDVQQEDDSRSNDNDNDEFNQTDKRHQKVIEKKEQ